MYSLFQKCLKSIVEIGLFLTSVSFANLFIWTFHVPALFFFLMVEPGMPGFILILCSLILSIPVYFIYSVILWMFVYLYPYSLIILFRSYILISLLIVVISIILCLIIIKKNYDHRKQLKRELKLPTCDKCNEQMKINVRISRTRINIKERFYKLYGSLYDYFYSNFLEERKIECKSCHENIDGSFTHTKNDKLFETSVSFSKDVYCKNCEHVHLCVNCVEVNLK